MAEIKKRKTRNLLKKTTLYSQNAQSRFCKKYGKRLALRGG